MKGQECDLTFLGLPNMSDREERNKLFIFLQLLASAPGRSQHLAGTGHGEQNPAAVPVLPHVHCYSCICGPAHNHSVSSLSPSFPISLPHTLTPLKVSLSATTECPQVVVTFPVPVSANFLVYIFRITKSNYSLYSWKCSSVSYHFIPYFTPILKRGRFSLLISTCQSTFHKPPTAFPTPLPCTSPSELLSTLHLCFTLPCCLAL